MKSILDEWWYGNVCLESGCRELTKESRELLARIVDCRDEIETTLNDKQRAAFDKIEEYYAELMDANERRVFAYAFRLGARIGIDVMSTNFD